MGNQPSGALPPSPRMRVDSAKWKDDKEKYRSFPGSAILEKTFCGSIDTTDPSEYQDVSFANRLLKRADIMCISSPDEHKHEEVFFDPADLDQPKNKASALLARALVSEVTDNPKTMKQSEMTAREKQLLKAQQAAHTRRQQHALDGDSHPVGAPGGFGAPSVLSSLAYAVTGDETVGNVCVNPKDIPGRYGDDFDVPLGPCAVTIGLSLSRRHSGVGHPDTVTRQTAFDFNELQDRNYKYVSSTDSSGWRAGGGERGGTAHSSDDAAAAFEEGISTHHQDGANSPSQNNASANEKIPSPDVVHIPIIHINCESNAQVAQIIHSLASGEIFIPHMAVLPQALSVNGISPPDLVVRFDCERNDEMPPDEWPNWCLEFMHNQLYEYFYSVGARWTKRPFSITLARKVKWKTVKHMNRYFAHAEQVIERWRHAGPQFLDPQLSYIEGGATPEEVANPHGIYLMRNGVATNYFAPNFDPPYTTKMTRSLLENVLNKSWSQSRQEWSSEPIPKMLTPNLLLAMACGCTEPSADGFIAREVTAASVRKTAKEMPAVHDKFIGEVTSPQYSESQASGSRRHRRSHSYQSGDAEEEEEESYCEQEEESPVHAKPPSSPTSPVPVPPVETVTSETTDEEVREMLTPTDEEKKTDDVSEMSGNSKERSTSRPKSAWRSTSNMTDSSGDFGSQFSPSLAMSGTTVMHANVSKQSEKKLSEDDWAKPVKPEATPIETPHQARWSKKKKDKPSARDMLDQERKRNEMLLMKVQSGESSTSSKKERGKGSQYTMAPVTSSPGKKEIDQSDSGASMEYSQDGSSAFFTDGGSTLLGQHFAGDASVSSNKNKSTKLTQKSYSNTTDEDENSALMSVQESTSSLSVVPTDEELLAIGWAKALDAASGNYYYYTLDRKKIVWENPLSSNQSSVGSGKEDP